MLAAAYLAALVVKHVKNTAYALVEGRYFWRLTFLSPKNPAKPVVANPLDYRHANRIAKREHRLPRRNRIEPETVRPLAIWSIPARSSIEPKARLARPSELPGEPTRLASCATRRLFRRRAPPKLPAHCASA